MNRGFLNGVSCSILMVTCALGVSACTPQAVSLHPQAIGATQGAVFGRVTAFLREQDETKDVTVGCEITFTRSGGGDQTLELDSGGWVFTAIQLGPTRLSRIKCRGRDLETPELKFNVPGGGKIAYFGDIHATFPGDSTASGPVGEDTVQMTDALAVTGAVIGAAAGKTTDLGDDTGNSVAASPNKLPDAWYKVEDRYDAAVTECRSRYGADMGGLQPISNIVPGAPEQPKAPPATFVGFSLRKNVAGAEASCAKAGLAWQAQDDEHFSCNGTPLDLGAPATVKVTACSGAISEVAVNAGSDGAAWSVLAQRAIAISRLLAGKYGNPHAHDTNLLSDCNEEIKSCFARGRARTTTIWRWAGDENLKVTLDGGPPGSPPSLTVVYTTSAHCQAKPAESPTHS